MRSTVKCKPPKTTTCPTGIVKTARRKGVIAVLRGKVRISTMAISIHTATSGCSSVSVAPPPNRMFCGSIGYALGTEDANSAECRV